MFHNRRRTVNLFFTDEELENVSKWEYKVVDNSITSAILSPIFDIMVKFIPDTVAPNIITLSSFAITIQAFWILYLHGEEYP